jgi:hyperosmotically inducible protein
VKRLTNRTVPTLALAGTLLAGAGAACNREEAAPSATSSTPATAVPDTTVSDAGITTSVQAKYYSDDRVRGRNVYVTTENGMVTLRGAVESDEARQRAVALAREVQGVKDVRNQLTVQTAATTERQQPPAAGAAENPTATSGHNAANLEPASITTKIQAQYFTSRQVKPWNVDVTTSSDGVVTLEGEVEKTADRTEAVRIARETEGVTRVEDRLRVTGDNKADANPPAVERPDVWLTAKVQSKYFVDDLVKLRNIDVETQNATVTLSGAVGSEAERRQALALARTTEGVRDVIDHLKVDPAAAAANRSEAEGDSNRLNPVPALKRPDPWITMKVQSQFFLDPEIKGHEINVDTTGGVVSLKGTVENQQQKQQAERIARETEGVTRVNNQLTVGATR